MRTPLLLAVALHCAAAPALAQDGVCDPFEEMRDRCFVTASGYVVEAVTGPLGEFPIVDASGDSVFAYSVTGPGVGGGSCAGVADISHASILVPVCDPVTGEGPSVIGALPAVEIKDPGQGDPSCGFGAGDGGNRVVKWDVGSDCNGASIYSITVDGVVPAAPTQLSLKAGNSCVEGTILGPSCESPFEPYCVPTDCPCGNNPTNGGGCANSTGDGGVLSYTGSNSVSADDLVLQGSNLPANQFAIFLYARSFGNTEFPLGSGLLCIGGAGIKIIRVQPIAQIDAMGNVSTQPNLIALANSGTLAQPQFGAITPGSTYDFQLYYRDVMPVGTCNELANLTNALQVTFTN